MRRISNPIVQNECHFLIIERSSTGGVRMGEIDAATKSL